jgi:two-component system chemotaxis response regulator CheY
MSAPLRILIADDHEPFRTMLKSMLGSLGAQLVECRDGREAVERFREFEPDWVLMDIEMPQLDGFSATRQIMALNPRARVVMVTDHDDADLRAEAGRAGAAAYVRKDNLQVLPGLLQGPPEQVLPLNDNP